MSDTENWVRAVTQAFAERYDRAQEEERMFYLTWIYALGWSFYDI